MTHQMLEGMLNLPPPIFDLPPQNSAPSNDSGALRTFTEGPDPQRQLEMLERLGKGSFGAVYKAKHTPTGSFIAVKKMLVEDLEECLSEIEIMKECSCPQVVDYFGHFMKDEHLWIIMEYCGLGALGDVMALSKRKTLVETEIASILRHMLLGLEYMHSLGKIHRDIKPDNVLLNEKGECKLADFGVAGKSSTLEKRSTLTGTPYYIAPEVLKEDESGYDARADVWSLGICALQLAQGAVPYAELPPMKVMLYIANNPAPQLKGAENFTPSFNSFVTQSLIKDPAMRASSRLLLESEFIRKASTTSNEVTLASLIKDAGAAIKSAGGLESALKALKNAKPVGSPLVASGSVGGQVSPQLQRSPSLNQYGASPAPASQYGASAAPASNQYGASASPQLQRSPSNQYGASAAPSSQYGASAAPSNQYGAPSSQYGAPVSISTAEKGKSNSFLNLPSVSSQYGSPSGNSPRDGGLPAFNPYAPPSTSGQVPLRQGSGGIASPGAINRQASGSFSGALPQGPVRQPSSGVLTTAQVARPSSPISTPQEKLRDRRGSSPEVIRKNNTVSDKDKGRKKGPEIPESKAREEKPTIKKMLQKFLISRPSEKDLAKKKILFSTIFDDDYYGSGGKKKKK
eukprot:TRINITY_DN271_c0_g1_i1.p1 TRINITY_DN271_c0_g1~~TRINITY_DN271_c0_g1_i1.p1  ORF type:complete len:630 (+),score=205.34 TRINITY_DN271_c0_g1_i1:185-2074(+)